ncbi:MAG: Rad52/Rad22 family DNA repair protein [Thermodesulfobacteriota bacterium]
MNRDILEKPFPPEHIKQREGTFGRVLDYIEGHHIIHRLNDAFDSLWSFEIMGYQVLEEQDEVIVLGKLSAEGIWKSQFGSSRIKRAKETVAIISIAADLKAAATDSLKKCATMLAEVFTSTTETVLFEMPRMEATEIAAAPVRARLGILTTQADCPTANSTT